MVCVSTKRIFLCTLSRKKKRRPSYSPSIVHHFDRLFGNMRTCHRSGPTADHRYHRLDARNFRTPIGGMRYARQQPHPSPFSRPTEPSSSTKPAGSSRHPPPVYLHSAYLHLKPLVSDRPLALSLSRGGSPFAPPAAPPPDT